VVAKRPTPRALRARLAAVPGLAPRRPRELEPGGEAATDACRRAGIDPRVRPEDVPPLLLRDLARGTR
jgi:hypothetical protein